MSANGGDREVQHEINLVVDGIGVATETEGVTGIVSATGTDTETTGAGGIEMVAGTETGTETTDPANTPDRVVGPEVAVHHETAQQAQSERARHLLHAGLAPTTIDLSRSNPTPTVSNPKYLWT